jgi:hypothetical protein
MNSVLIMFLFDLRLLVHMPNCTGSLRVSPTHAESSIEGGIGLTIQETITGSKLLFREEHVVIKTCQCVHYIKSSLDVSDS